MSEFPITALLGGLGGTIGSAKSGLGGAVHTPSENRAARMRRLSDQQLLEKQMGVLREANKLQMEAAEFEHQCRVLGIHRQQRSTEGLHLKLHPFHASVELVPPAQPTAKPSTKWEKQIFKIIHEIIRLHTVAHGKPKTIILGKFEAERFRRFFQGPKTHTVRAYVPQDLPRSEENKYMEELMKPQWEQDLEQFDRYAYIRSSISEDPNEPISIAEPREIEKEFPHYCMLGLDVVQSNHPHMIDVSCQNWYHERKKQINL